MLQKRSISYSRVLADSSLFPINNWPTLTPEKKHSRTNKTYLQVVTTTNTTTAAAAAAASSSSSSSSSSDGLFAKSTKTSLYKRSTHPTSVPLSKIFSNQFPLSLKESIEDYKLRHDILAFQHNLLSTLPFFPHEDNLGRSSQVLKIPIDSKGNFINEFVIYPKGMSDANSKEMKHLVMIHGYGAGLGFFLKNFNTIASKKNWCIHAIDLFGYGCSSRPHFYPDHLEQVEDWFHDSYETWFSQKNIPKENLLVMAHSMGAYLMACYGIARDPSFCKKLLMVSPGAIVKHRKKVNVPGYFTKLWEQNISPFSLVRKAGPLGSKLVSGWSSRRFSKLESKESQLLHKYAYGIFQARGSGEYMLNYLLAPGANARHPLIEKGIHRLKCDLSWWYGDADWMDKKGGELCSNILNNYHKAKKSDVKIISKSGHHIYLDNIEKFNELVLQEMHEMEK
ncbi:hypothetical protein KGF56_000093 [Candida oxycetoniae]|uniref:AB hydrolase-1 domain-containing protein n=1 Tax=Candida oxycetoniae TaxID=497107 RepID=A0AAI9X0I4_9ASCO|nr:uncharacterized protein KGF56_000093 [Candida oxycetoniae]KAI3407105.2 hypothetical protein KGF56_000093 [Candida oxycetoniae]